MLPAEGHKAMHDTTHTGRAGRYAAESSSIRWGIVLNAVFFVFEAVAGVVSGSVALISDAVHDLSDVFALSLSWLAVRKADAPRDARRSWGYHRAAILAAFVNSLVLMALAGFVFVQSYARLRAPEPVDGGIVFGVAVIGIVVNGAVALRLSRHAQTSLNARSIFWHMAEDALGWLGVLVSGVVLLLSDFYAIDALAGIFIGAVILRGAYGVLKDAAEILLEATPAGIDPDAVSDTICSIGDVMGVHDLHIWSIGSDILALSAHVIVPDMRLSASEGLTAQIQQQLAAQYGILHATIAYETADTACDLPH